MGYTHYWTFKKTDKTRVLENHYQIAISDCNKVIKYYNRAVKRINEKHYSRLSGYSAFTSDYGGIKFNGVGKFMHEDFTLREHFNQNFENFGKGFDFCKTARKPYDIVGTACLCILKYRLGNAIEVESDGEYLDFNEGLELARKVLKRKIKNPIMHGELKLLK